MLARGYRCEVRPAKEPGKQFGLTAWCADWPTVNDKPYYCQPGLWPEACVEGRRGGPVAPDGHPSRTACESQFFNNPESPCGYLYVQSSSHMSLDPFVVINGVNQNHPRNVQVCKQKAQGTPECWRKEPHQGHLYVVAGCMAWATAHGNGKVCGAAKASWDSAGNIIPVAPKCVNYVEP